jgi:hypothetical protein
LDTIGDSITKQGWVRLKSRVKVVNSCSSKSMTYSGHYNRCLCPKTRVIAEVLRRAQCYQPLDLFLGEKCRLSLEKVALL